MDWGIVEKGVEMAVKELHEVEEHFRLLMEGVKDYAIIMLTRKAE